MRQKLLNAGRRDAKPAKSPFYGRVIPICPGKAPDIPHHPNWEVNGAAHAGESCTVVRTASRPWASALFQGRRHEVTMTLIGTDVATRLAAMVEGIGEAEWHLPGHFVADISVDAQQVATGSEGNPVATLELSALTIEEW
jgi:hypothetical protein